jgi:hypothetical protein
MKHGGKLLVCVMGGLTVCTAASAVTSQTEAPGNPYQSIIDRNVFSLKPPPPPVDPAETTKPTVVKITLTGITTILGNKRVLMKTAPPPGKPGEGPKTDQSYILTEGQREGDIEVIQIDDKAGSVKVNNAGTIQTLTFEKDGAKLPSTPAPVIPGVPGGFAPQIPGLPVTRPGPGGVTPTFQLPTRVPRLPNTGSQASNPTPGFGSASPVAGAASSSVAPGFLPGNTTSSPNPPPTTTPTRSYSLEEQQILIEAERQMGGPTAALLPPTALTPKTPEPGTGTPAPAQQTPTIPLPIPGRPIPPGPY